MTNQKTWFITGASRGLGLSITQAVLETGNNVVATVRTNPDELASILGNNPKLHVIQMDVTNEEQVIAAAQSAVEKFGKIDVLVNSAGYGLLGAIEESSAKEVIDNFNVNVFGVLNTIRAILPFMRKNRLGHIINISSVGGLSANYGWGVYGATKFAVEGITEALALELAPLGINATVVAPGFFRTNFLDESSLKRTESIIEDYDNTVGQMRKLATMANNNQPGNPKKLAEAIIKVAAAKKPPLHLPLGTDSLLRFRNKTKNFEKDISNWHDVIIATDYLESSK